MDGLNLEIQDGSVYGVLGPNGSGKSTTIRMMTDLISPDEGEMVLIYSKDKVNQGMDDLIFKDYR